MFSETGLGGRSQESGVSGKESGVRRQEHGLRVIRWLFSFCIGVCGIGVWGNWEN